MRVKRYVGILCLVLLFAAAGCGQKEVGSQPITTEEATPEKGITPIETVQEEQVTAPIPAAPPIPKGPAVGEPVPVPTPVPPQQAKAGAGLIIADFETWPDNLGGEIGVFGSLEPDWEKVNQQPVSWVYEVTSLNYSPDNVHSGESSFRLVNAVGIKPEYTWGSFSMDLGPTTDITAVPKKVESFDASAYNYLTFWVKGARGGEKMEFLARDAHALNYMPQVKYKLSDATIEWQMISIPLSELSSKVDLTKLDNIGIAFGKDVGNMTGDTIYLDDFAFTDNP
jgi:hypothetical protein